MARSGKKTDDLSQVPVVPPTDFAFRIGAEVLSDLLARATVVLPTGHLQEVLKNVRFDLGSSLQIVGTNTDLAAFLTTPHAEVLRQGSGVLPGKRMLEIASSVSPDSEFVFDVKDGIAHIEVSGSRTKWELRVPDGSLFPELPDVAAVRFHTVDRMALADAITLVRSTVSSDTIRPQLQMVDITEGKVRSSDSVRYQQVVLDEWPELSMQIPVAALDAVLRLLRGSETSTVEIGETDDFFAFRSDDEIFVMTRLVDPFPALIEERLLKPALANGQRLAVDPHDLLAAIRRVRITADPETSAVTLALSPGALTVRTRDTYQNTAVDEIEAEWSGKDREVTFRYQHLTDLLRSVKSGSCTFFLGADKKTARSPVLFRDDDAAFVAVVSQLRA